MIKLKYFKYISITKILNLLRLYFHYYLRDFNNLSHPSFISFEPTNFCNLNCPECPTGNGTLIRKKGFADIELLKKIVSENRKYLLHLILYFQGEPFLHKNIGDMINLASKAKIFTTLSTNANLLVEYLNSNKNHLPNKIIISLDGITKDTYEKYRIGGNFFKVIDSLRIISELPKVKKPFIEVQFLVFDHNENEISKLKDFLSNYKVDKISLKSVQIHSNDRLNILPKNKKYSRYEISKEGFKPKNKIKNKCKRVILGSVITWDGTLIPCCFDKDADFAMGNISNKEIKEIRNSESYVNFVKTIFQNRKSIDICNNCTEGQKDINIKL